MIEGKEGVLEFYSFNSSDLKPIEKYLATVIPDSPTTIVAIAIIPVSNFGKIEIGQIVNIKLSGFPYMEFGVLFRLRLIHISMYFSEK